MEFVVTDDTVINAERVLFIKHEPDTLNLKPSYATEAEIPEGFKSYYVQTEGQWELALDIRPSNESYCVLFDTGKELRLGPQRGKPLIERFRTLSKPSDGNTATTSDDAT